MSDTQNEKFKLSSLENEVLGGTILALQGAENVPLLVQDVGPAEFAAERITWMGVGEEDDGEIA